MAATMAGRTANPFTYPGHGVPLNISGLPAPSFSQKRIDPSPFWCDLRPVSIDLLLMAAIQVDWIQLQCKAE